jgi:hypothetical protein
MMNSKLSTLNHGNDLRGVNDLDAISPFMLGTVIGASQNFVSGFDLWSHQHAFLCPAPWADQEHPVSPFVILIAGRYKNAASGLGDGFERGNHDAIAEGFESFHRT